MRDDGADLSLPPLPSCLSSTPSPVVQCPMCGEGELYQLDDPAPRHRHSGTVLPIAREAWRVAYWACQKCRACGTMAELESKANRKENRTPAEKVDQEILECMMEDQRRGSPGSSSSKSGKRTQKPGDKLLNFRPEQESAPCSLDPRSRTVITDPHFISHHLRWTADEIELLDQLADLYGQTLSTVVRTAALWWAREAALGNGFIKPETLPAGRKIDRIVKWTGQEAALVAGAAQAAEVSFPVAVRMAVLVWVEAVDGLDAVEAGSDGKVP